MEFPDLRDLRWKKVTNLSQSDLSQSEHATLTVESPDCPYAHESDYLVARDGARSEFRIKICLDLDGQLFEERFLIADIEMQGTSPPSPASGSSRISIPAGREPETIDHRRRVAGVMAPKETEEAHPLVAEAP